MDQDKLKADLEQYERVFREAQQQAQVATQAMLQAQGAIIALRGLLNPEPVAPPPVAE